MDEDPDGIQHDVGELGREVQRAADELAEGATKQPFRERALHVARRLDRIAEATARIARRIREAFANSRLIVWLNRHGLERRTRIAISMVIIATLGAVTAFRASEHQQKAFSCERRLSEARAYEAVQRQAYLEKLEQHERWESRYAILLESGRRLLRQADASHALSHSAAAGVGLLDIHAQVANASARVVQPLFALTDTGVRAGPTLERALRRRAQSDVRALGLPNRCSPGDVVTASDVTVEEDYLEPLREQIDTIHVQTLQASRAVLLFLCTLVCLSVSEAFPGRARTVFQTIAGLCMLGALLTTRSGHDIRLYHMYATAMLLFGFGPLLWIAIYRIVPTREPLKPPSGKALQRRIYRIARFVLTVAAYTLALITAWTFVVAPHALPIGWQTAVAASIVFAGVVWLMLLTGKAQRTAFTAQVAAIGKCNAIALPWGVILGVLAFVLSFVLAPLASQRAIVALGYAVPFAIALWLFGTAVRTWIEPMQLQVAEVVDDEKKLQRLNRIGWICGFVALALLLSVLLPFVPPLLAALVVIALPLSVAPIGEHLVEFRHDFPEQPVESSHEAPKEPPDPQPAAHHLRRTMQRWFLLLWAFMIITAACGAAALVVPSLGWTPFYSTLLLAVIWLVVFWFAFRTWAKDREPAFAVFDESLRDRGTSRRPAVDPTPSLEVRESGNLNDVAQSQDAPHHPAVPDPTPSLEYRDPVTVLDAVQSHDTPNVFAAVVMACIGITAIFSAAAGFAYTAQHIDASSASARAAEAQVSLLHATTREAARVYHQLDAFTTAVQAHISRASDAQFALGVRPTAAPWQAQDEVAIAEDAARRHVESASTAQDDLLAVPGLTLLDVENGADDPRYPAPAFSRATTEVTARELALWDAYDEQSTVIEERGTKLLGAVALFAIALYLLGQGLYMGSTGRAGYLLAALGIIMALSGLSLVFPVLSAPRSIDAYVAVPDECTTSEDPISTTRAEAAALCFARAEFLASTARDREGFVQAHEAYAAATADALRPEFALARYRAALITSRAASPQANSSYVSIIDRSAVTSLIPEDLAVEEDLVRRDRIVSPSLIDNEGFHRYFDALEHDNEGPALLKSALTTHTRIGESELRRDPMMRFHRALLELASANTNQAREQYDLALGTRSVTQAMLFAAISDLRLLSSTCKFSWRNRCPGLRDVADQIRANMIARLSQTDVRPLSAGRLKTRDRVMRPLSVTVHPGGVLWELKGTKPTDLAQRGAVVVYRRDEKWNALFVLPELSGAISAAELRRLSGVITARGFRSPLADHAGSGCIAATGAYHVEIYLGSRLIAQADAFLPRDASRYRAVAMREVGVAACIPGGRTGWERDPPIDMTVTEGYTSPDGRSGMRIFGWFSGRAATAPERSRAERSYLLASTKATSSMLRAGDGRTSGVPAAMTCPGTGYGTHGTFASGNVTMHARAWSHADGLVFVGLSWYEGDAETAAGATRDVACGVLASMVSTDMGTVSTGIDLP